MVYAIPQSAMVEAMDKEPQDESTIEKHFEMILLRPWQEVVGNLEHISRNERLLEVRMTTNHGLVRLVFNRDSPEAKQIHDVLLDLPRGSRVGILRTDSKSSPILIRTVPRQ